MSLLKHSKRPIRFRPWTALGGLALVMACGGGGGGPADTVADVAPPAALEVDGANTLAAFVDGTGRVVVREFGVDCSGLPGAPPLDQQPCTARLGRADPQVVVRFEAEAPIGHRLAGWFGECSHSEPVCEVAVPFARANELIFASARFEAVPTVEMQTLVSAVVGGAGKLVSAPQGIDCDGFCRAPFNVGSTVSVTALPAPGSRLRAWSGVCAGQGGSTCTVTMDTALSVRAEFEPQNCAAGHDLNNDPADGCEYVCSIVSTNDRPDPEGKDENCDGVDGVRGRVIHVDATYLATQKTYAGNDANAGLAPHQAKRTLQAGIAAAQACSLTPGAPCAVLVRSGPMVESFSMKPGIGVHGGYDATFRGSRVRAGTIVSAPGSGAIQATVLAHGLGDTATELSGFRIAGPTLYPTSLIASSYAVWLRDTRALRIVDSDLQGGFGRPGGPGTHGWSGAPGGDATPIAAGGSRFGSAGGSRRGLACVSVDNTNYFAGTGGDGGSAGQCSSGFGRSGSLATGQVGGQATGGPGGRHDCAEGCSVLPSTQLDASPGGNLGPMGARGTSGVPQLLGPGAVDTAGHYTVPPAVTTAGFGLPGSGGGGGGAGGTDTTAALCTLDGVYVSLGGGGGGGGGGGCGGFGGSNGLQGGAAITLWLAARSRVLLEGTNLYAGIGGRGGLGGNGGAGGEGGLGAAGSLGESRASPITGLGTVGGRGGRGGNGGRGGGGGGGAGGAGGATILIGLTRDSIYDPGVGVRLVAPTQEAGRRAAGGTGGVSGGTSATRGASGPTGAHYDAWQFL
jgi:Divergent InlB B-repeat domain